MDVLSWIYKYKDIFTLENAMNVHEGGFDLICMDGKIAYVELDTLEYGDVGGLNYAG